MTFKERYFKTLALFFILLFALISRAGDSVAQEPITLKRAIEIAMKNSPEIKRYQLSLERGQQFLAARKASLKSQFGLTLNPIDYSYQRRFYNFFSKYYTSETKRSAGSFFIKQPIAWTDGTLTLFNDFSWIDSYSEFQDTKSKTFSNNLYLSFTQPIFTYNRTKLDLRGLELDLENSALNFAIQKLYLEYQVTQNFFNVYQQKARLEIAKEEYRNREQSYAIIKNKVEAGLDPREELYQAELDLTQSKSNVQNAQVALDNFLDTFKRQIGLSLYDDVMVTADISHHPVEVDLQKALDNGLKYRMEIRQRQIQVENAKYDLIAAAASNEFRGDISLTYGVIGTDEKANQIFDSPTKNQTISLSLNIPLFDWGEKKARIKAYQAMVKTSELSLEEQKKDIIIQIRKAYRNLKNLTSQIEIAEQALRNAQLTYDINLERYKNGDLTSMDLNLIQNQLSDAKLNKIKALINYKVELLNLKILSLYDFEKNQRVIPAEIKSSAIQIGK